MGGYDEGELKESFKLLAVSLFVWKLVAEDSWNRRLGRRSSKIAIAASTETVTCKARS
jgi:hypothetical protein